MSFQQRYQYNHSKDLIGKGGFARVYKAKDVLLDREVAIKVFNATDKGQYTVIEEIKKAIRLHHPNLLRYYDVAVVENVNALGETETIQIGVMELANAGDLKQFSVKNPGSPLLFTLLKQVLSGLEYLHQKGIIHRDLKPQNILLVEEDGELTAKISDFGISKNLSSGTNSSSMAIGTIEYMAPEQFNPAKYGINGKISTNVDLWSFGIMINELLTNEPLFGQRSGNTTAEEIMNAILSQTLPASVELLKEPYKTVVKKCLISDAKQRIQKANELVGYLNDSESAGNNDTLVLDKKFLAKQQITQPLVTPEKKKEKPVEKKPAKEIPEKEPANTKSKTIYGLAAFIVFAIIASIAFWYFKIWNPKQTSRKEYIEGMAHYGDSTSDFLQSLEKSAALGNDSASFRLAGYYMSQGADKQSFPYLQRLIDTTNGKVLSNYPGIISFYAEALMKGGNKSRAQRIWEDGTEAGDPDCIFQLGMLYYSGLEVRQDYTKAMDLFHKGVGKNDSRSECMLGNMYLLGQGVKVNNSEAIKYFYKAADLGNSMAMYALGLIYTNGNGVTKDEEEAHKWFQQVVDKNNNPEAVKAAKEQLGMNVQNNAAAAADTVATF